MISTLALLSGFAPTPPPAFDYSIWIPTTHELVRAASAASTVILFGAVFLFLFRKLAARFKLMATLLLMFITLTLYFGILGLKPHEFHAETGDPIVYWFNRAIAALLVYAALRIFDRLVFIPILSRGGKVPVARFVHQIVNIVIALFAILSFGSVAFKWDISTFLAGSAVVSIVLGLALQETLGNFFSGLVLQASPPFSLGHFITIDKHEGRIVDMTWRAVTLHTEDDNFIVIPNATIAKAEITNFHAPSTANARIVTIGLDPDIEPTSALEALAIAASETPGVLQKPPPKPLLQEYTASGVTYALKFWINEPARHKDIEHQVRLNLWYRLAERNIPIPIPSLAMEHVPSAHKRAARDAAAMELRERAIDSVTLLQPLTREQKHELARTTDDLQFTTGQIVFRQNDAGDSCYIIRRGTVDVLINAGEGSAEMKKVATLGPGDFFGEMSALTGQPRSATIRAATAVAFVRVEKRDLAPIFEKDSPIMEKISAVVAQRNAHRESIIAGLGSEPTAEVVSTQQKSILSRMANFFRLAPKN